MKPIPIVLLLVAGLLAGCADAGSQPATAPETKTEEGLGEQLDGKVVAQSGNATLGVDTPFLLHGATGPDSPITSFLWTIPEGAIETYRPIASFPEFVIETITFEMFPIIPDDVTLDEFAFLIINIADDAYISSGLVGTPITVRDTTPTGGDSEVYAAELESGLFQVYAGALEEGDTIAFALTGRSATAGDLDILMRPAKADSAEIPQSADALLANQTAIQLPVKGEGAGFQYAHYLNLNLMFSTVLYGIEETTPAVVVEDRMDRLAEPAATVRDVTVSATFDGAGHTEAFVYYFGSAHAAAGKYALALDLHGVQASQSNVILETPCAVLCPPTSLLLGIPLGIGVGDGVGSSTTSIDLQIGSANEFEIFWLDQVDLGATLEELTGVSAAVGAATFNGIAGSIPPTMLWTEGNDLVTLADGKMVRLPGHGERVQGYLDQI